VLRVATFDAKTAGGAAAAVREMAAEGAEAWVVDLRGNGGGLVRAAQQIAGLFLPEGTPLVEVTSARQPSPALIPTLAPPCAAPSPATCASCPAGDVSSVPGGAASSDFDQEGADASGMIAGRGKVAVVLDGGSASASEFLATALRDYRGGAIVGQPSRGKALIQGLFPLEGSPRGGLVVTTARVASAKTHQGWQGQGLRPDFPVQWLAPAWTPLPLPWSTLAQALARQPPPSPLPPRASDATAPDRSAGGSQGGTVAQGAGGESASGGSFRCPSYWACGWDEAR